MNRKYLVKIYRALLEAGNLYSAFMCVMINRIKSCFAELPA